jgi:membrane protein DedA with SNARE-associated domain
MLTAIIGFLSQIIISIINSTGYTGIFILMFFESCGIPIPSEIIMPFSGFLVATREFNFWLVALIGTLGNLGGSILAYYIGYIGGRPLIEKYGKYILISKHDLDKADGWFIKHGDATVFFGRLLPILRTYISFPAGVTKMNFKKFCFYTFTGALPWCVLFTWLGVKMQHNWQLINSKLESFNLLVVAVVLVTIIWYVIKHLKNRKTY